ncbi:MAG: hypothetical protein Q8S13_11980, partial [Dehalococcoidia bacterium]|nr:hypothetical protein [Dehalococcoidia bacterium]
DTLSQLGLAGKPRLTALNKIDLLDGPAGAPISDPQELAEYELSLAQHQPDAVLISAERGWELDELLGRIDSVLERSRAPVG